MAHIRGSPFSVEAADPWQQRGLVGVAPAKRAAATLSSVGTDLVLFGGDKSLAAVCHAPGGEEPWQWFPTSEADRATARKGHAAAGVAGTKQLVVCGGQALEGEPADLADVRLLVSNGSSFAGTSWHWQPASAAVQLHQWTDGTEVPTERNSHCAVAFGSTLLVFGGEHQGQLLQELCLLDLSSKVGAEQLLLCAFCMVCCTPPALPFPCISPCCVLLCTQAQLCWVEPAVEGTLPSARKGAAAAAAGDGFVAIFGGCASNEQGEDVLLNDLHLVQVESLSRVRCGQQEASGAAPPPRAGAILQEYGSGRLLLYGGTGAGGRPLGDAWVLDVAAQTWECLYDGEPQVCWVGMSGSVEVG